MSSNLFDRSVEYDRMLQDGIRLSGEDKTFFIRGRLEALTNLLPARFYPSRILDFGCGIGDTSRRLSKVFPKACVVGADTSHDAIRFAQDRFGNERVSFVNIEALKSMQRFDLCYTNGVFHHIEPCMRENAVEIIRQSLENPGYFALFENNPWNPGTRMVMRRIPFDREAKPLSCLQAKRLIIKGGFAMRQNARFLFYFPRALSFLRFSEPWLARLPLGAQYLVLGMKQVIPDGGVDSLP